jgi:hypothetical protein
MRAVEFTFARDWTHAGVTYGRGDSASLPECDARMLAEAGAGEASRPTVDDEPERSRRKPKSPQTEPA